MHLFVNKIMQKLLDRLKWNLEGCNMSQEIIHSSEFRSVGRSRIFCFIFFNIVMLSIFHPFCWFLIDSFIDPERKIWHFWHTDMCECVQLGVEPKRTSGFHKATVGPWFHIIAMLLYSIKSLKLIDSGIVLLPVFVLSLC